MFMFSARIDFKILSKLLLILDFIYHIDYCIRCILYTVLIKKNIVNFSFLHIFYFSLIWKFER